METIFVGLKNEKAKQLLTDLAALNLIEIKQQSTVKPTGKLSELRHKIKGRMTEEKIDSHLKRIRDEWQRVI